jgi:hypothetical protein
VPATITEEYTVTRPEFFRLPKPGNSDKFFGFSRSFYYAAEKRGWLRLIRIRGEGKERGVTLIEYSKVAEFVRAQVEAQNE